MFIPSLRSRRASCPVFAFAVSMLPCALPAQPPQPGVTVGNSQVKQVDIMVDFVEVPQVKLVEASQWIAAGPQHDAQLLAALVKNGASDTEGIPVRCPDGATFERGGPVAPALGTTGRVPGEDFECVTKGMPHFNTDGTMTVTLAAFLEAPFHSETPVVRASAALTFRDGQTLEIGRTLTPYAAGQIAHLVFAKVAVVSGSLTLLPGSFNPLMSPGLLALPRVLTVPLFSAPPSIDPGMVGVPPDTGDHNMVIGRGTDPKRLNRMNARTLPAPPAPKRK